MSDEVLSRTTIMEVVRCVLADSVDEIPAPLIGLAACDTWVVSPNLYALLRRGIDERRVRPIMEPNDAMRVPLFNVRIVVDPYIASYTICGIQRGKIKALLVLEGASPAAPPG